MREEEAMRQVFAEELVTKFTMLMRMRFKMNVGRGQWSEIPPVRLLAYTIANLGEVAREFDKGWHDESALAFALADCANYCAILAERLGCLEPSSILKVMQASERGAEGNGEQAARPAR